MGQPHLKSFKHIRLALGFHPLLASENKNELPLFNSLLDKTSYIGEIGLDFSKEGLATKDDQVLILRKLLEKLEGKKKIISVHSRMAEKELFDLLCEYNINNVIFHWYSGPIDLIPSIISKGYYFSVNEAMTISKNGRNIIDRIPRDRILTESDAPYNSKANISETLINLAMSEYEISYNFKNLIAKIRNSN
jgi:TatD DNase family protein